MHDFPCTIILTFNKNRLKKKIKGNQEITNDNKSSGRRRRRRQLFGFWGGLFFNFTVCFPLTFNSARAPQGTGNGGSAGSDFSVLGLVMEAPGVLGSTMTRSVPPGSVGICSIPLGCVGIHSISPGSVGIRRGSVGVKSDSCPWGADAVAPPQCPQGGGPCFPSPGDPGVNGDSAKSKQTQ